MKPCAICGTTEFADQEILWPELIEAWGLSEEEVAQINRQQGTRCLRCSNNLRALALAQAIMAFKGYRGTFNRFVKKWAHRRLKILSVNTCGTLHRKLTRLKGLTLAEYPEHDIHDLKMEDESFDLVLHSDTLEHVEDPLRALQECHRVLKPNGACIYTIPIVVGRMSRRTTGSEPSYHGDPQQRGEDWRVHSEYGCDAWLEPLQAGFSSCAIHAYEVPCALALICKK